MLLKNSRYVASEVFESEDGTRRVAPRAMGAATPVIEHEIAAGDRLDHLAAHYYGNDRLWWRIVDANPQFVFAGVVLDIDRAGQVLLIPRAVE